MLDNIMNEFAIRYFENGLTPIPVNTKTNEPNVKWSQYKDTSPTRVEIDEWIKQDLYKDGIAQITGPCYRGKFKGLYLNCVDFDDSSALNKLLEMYSLEQLADAGMFCEQHSDNKGKAHVWVFSTKPFPKLSAAQGNGIEVKSDGMLCNSFPSKHKSGNRYFPIGNSLKIFNDNVQPQTNDGFVNVIDKILGGKYLNGHANKNTIRVPIDERITEGARHNYLLSYANSTLRRLYDTTPPNIIKKMVQDVNLERCEPPLNDDEVEQIWNDALKFISEQVQKEGTKNASGNDVEEEDKEEKKKSKIKLAFETVRQEIKHLFIDEYQIPHVALPIEDHLEVLPINSGAFKNWYRMFIFERDGIVLESQTINDTCSLASAYAASHKYGSQINLNLRTALSSSFRTEWVYDLVNKDWEFIKITSSGWEIFKNEIIFRRYINQKAQVYPDRNYEADIFDQFMKLVNIKSDDKDGILLLKCYIVSLFIPEIQKVILILHGPQGAAKSSLQELIRTLVDPSIILTLTFPRDLNELIQQLSHNYVTYYDNVSMIKYWISDQLCRAVTGSGSSKRVLYTDDDDKIYNFKRCVGMNGINLAATKEDLLDRSIITSLEDIDDKDRYTPKQLIEKFNALRPQLLGYIFDILVKVLKYEEDNTELIEKFQLSRMTEFAKYGEIISRCMGNADGEFLRVYKENRNLQVDEIIEFSQVATALMCMMFQKYGESEGDFRKEWDGTPTQLYTEVKSIVDSPKWDLNIDIGLRQWPKTVNIFTRRLNEVRTILKTKGLLITDYKETGKQRTKHIVLRKTSSEPSEPSESEKSCSNSDKSSDDTSDDSSDANKVSSENNDQNRAQNEVSDDTDDADDTLHTSMGDVSEFIKLEGIQQGNKLIYNIEPTVGDLSVQNNFIGGHLRMRGEGGGRYPTNYLEFIDNVFGPERNTIEVCSNSIAGISKGSNCFTVDINSEYDPDLVVDGQTLEGIKDNIFDRWRSDPPYNEATAKEMYNCELPSVHKLLAAGARVVNPGSLMFLLCSKNVQSGTIGNGNIKRIGFLTISIVPNNETRILNIYVKLPEEVIPK